MPLAKKGPAHDFLSSPHQAGDLDRYRSQMSYPKLKNDYFVFLRG